MSNKSLKIKDNDIVTIVFIRLTVYIRYTGGHWLGSNVFRITWKTLSGYEGKTIAKKCADYVRKRCEIKDPHDFYEEDDSAFDNYKVFPLKQLPIDHKKRVYTFQQTDYVRQMRI
jgi:hypothetical protein